MKIRQGFVSNSSTTSFSVFGVYIDNEEDFLNALLGPSDGERDSADEYSDEIKARCGMDIVRWRGGSDANDGCYLGKDLQRWEKSVSAVEKIKILEDVLKKLKEIYPDVDPNFFSDGGYDG